MCAWAATNSFKGIEGMITMTKQLCKLKSRGDILRALHWSLWHRNFTCLQMTFHFYRDSFFSQSVSNLLSAANATSRNTIVLLYQTTRSLLDWFEENHQSQIRTVTILRCLCFIPLFIFLSVSTERIIDVILSATKTYGLGPELDG